MWKSRELDYAWPGGVFPSFSACHERVGVPLNDALLFKEPSPPALTSHMHTILTPNYYGGVESNRSADSS